MASYITALKNVVRVARTEGMGAMLRKVHLFNMIRPGVLRGTDEFGNKYFEDPSGDAMLRTLFCSLLSRGCPPCASRLPRLPCSPHPAGPAHPTPLISLAGFAFLTLDPHFLPDPRPSTPFCSLPPFPRPAVRSRWVEMNVDHKQKVNASRIPPEWHNWIHHIVDTVPAEDPRPAPIYEIKYVPTDLSVMGTEANYVPPGYLIKPKDIKEDTTYSNKRYHAWVPPAPVKAAPAPASSSSASK